MGDLLAARRGDPAHRRGARPLAVARLRQPRVDLKTSRTASRSRRARSGRRRAVNARILAASPSAEGMTIADLKQTGVAVPQRRRHGHQENLFNSDWKGEGVLRALTDMKRAEVALADGPDASSAIDHPGSSGGREPADLEQPGRRRPAFPVRVVPRAGASSVWRDTPMLLRLQRGEPWSTSIPGRGREARHRRRQLGADLRTTTARSTCAPSTRPWCDRVAYYFHAWEPHQFPGHKSSVAHPGLMKPLHFAGGDGTPGLVLRPLRARNPRGDTRVAIAPSPGPFDTRRRPDGRRMTTMQPEPRNRRVAMVLGPQQVPRLPDVHDRLQKLWNRDSGAGYAYWNNVETWPGRATRRAGPGDRRSMQAGEVKKRGEVPDLEIRLRPRLEVRSPGRDRLGLARKGRSLLRPDGDPSWGRTGRGPRRRHVSARQSLFLPAAPLQPLHASGVPRRDVRVRRSASAPGRHRARRPGPLPRLPVLRRGLPYKKVFFDTERRVANKCLFCLPASSRGVAPNLCAPVPDACASSATSTTKRDRSTSWSRSGRWRCRCTPVRARTSSTCRRCRRRRSTSRGRPTGAPRIPIETRSRTVPVPRCATPSRPSGRSARSLSSAASRALMDLLIAYDWNDSFGSIRRPPRLPGADREARGRAHAGADGQPANATSAGFRRPGPDDAEPRRGDRATAGDLAHPSALAVPGPVTDMRGDPSVFPDAAALFAPAHEESELDHDGRTGARGRGVLWRADTERLFAVHAEGVGTMRRSDAPAGWRYDAGTRAASGARPDAARLGPRSTAPAVSPPRCGAAPPRDRGGLKSVSPDWLQAT